MAIVLVSSSTAGNNGDADRILGAANAFEVLRLTVSNCSKERVQESFQTLMEPFLRATRDAKAAQVREKLKMARSILLDDTLRTLEANKVQSKAGDALREQAELDVVEVRTKLLEARAANILAVFDLPPAVVP